MMAVDTGVVGRATRPPPPKLAPDRPATSGRMGQRSTVIAAGGADGPPPYSMANPLISLDDWRALGEPSPQPSPNRARRAKFATSDMWIMRAPRTACATLPNDSNGLAWQTY